MQGIVIAAAKAAIPRPLRATVPRRDLVDQLDAADYRIAVVSAPAGFGKTVLLAEWADEHRDRTAWLSCDAADAEPTRFWSSLLVSLSTKWPGVGDDAAVLLDRLGTADHDMAVSIANDLAEVEAPIVIVIDDLHLARASAHVLGDFVSAMPMHVRLVLGSRVDPPFPTARLRVAGVLCELHSDDLRFTAPESAALLAANGVTVSDAELDRLHDLTEGWPAGVQLAALSLRKAGDRSHFLDAFGATDRAVTDFLVNEVLDTLPAERVEFLYRTSVFDEFDVELCEQVTGREDAGVVLDQLVADNLFIVPIEDGGRWYRYHHLFAAFLRARLRARGMRRLGDVHRRASEALEARGDLVGALRQALAVDDHERASSIVRNTIGRWMNISDSAMTATVARHWLHARGDELTSSDPEKVLEFVLALVVSSGADDAARWLTRVGQAHPNGSPELDALLQGVWAEHHLHRGQTDEGLRHAQLAMDLVGGAPPQRGPYPMIHPLIARAHLDAGDIAGARGVLDHALAASVGHPVLDDVRLPGLRSWVSFLDGDLSRAEAAATAVDERADELELPSHEVGRLFAGLARAGVLAERMDDDACDVVLGRLRVAAERGRRPPLQTVVALEQARVARLTGDEAAAGAHLARARMQLPFASAAVRFQLEEARQAVQFRPWAANELLGELEDSPDVRLLQARLMIRQDLLREAAELLHDLPPASTLREHVEVEVLLAVTVADQDAEAANAHLRDALTAALPERFVRTVIGQADSVAKLLTAFPPNRQLDEYVSELIDLADAVVAPVRPSVSTALAETLSTREVTVLRYLSSRMTNHEIASTLYVSVNTLKSHVKSIYRKLDVSSRSDAVEAGRRLRLI